MSRTLMLAPLLLVACNGTISEPGTPAGDRPPGAPPPETLAECTDEELVDPAERRVRRLTQEELDRTVRDLLGDESSPGAVLGADEQLGGFGANAVSALSQEQVDAWIDEAGVLAARAADRHAADWLACDRGADDCVRGWLSDFGLRAWRRPLTGEELDALALFHADALARWGEDDALVLTVQGMLASPDFLYHLEVGTGDGAIVPLMGYERASALSYFLWGTMPDDALFAAAAAGALDTADGVRAEAERMLDDPRAADSIESFARQWLGVEGADALAKDRDVFPYWTDATAQAVADEPGRFFSGVIVDGDARFGTLMTAPFTYGDDALAALYEADPPDPDGRIALDPTTRAGLLTTAGFIAGHSYAAEPSWVHRGKFVRERLLCQPLPSPPPDVDANETNDPGRLTSSECSACHQLMDPIGVGFEAYDATGRFRGGDAPGQIVGGADLGVAEEFDGPIELAHALADSEHVQGCFATQWFRYAVRRADTRQDACTLLALEDAFVSSGGDIRTLLVEIAASAAFTHRRRDAQ